MVLPFSLGLGGKLGDGKQWMPWISLEDWLRSVLFLLGTDTVDGPVNSVGPTPATNADFTNAFGGLLHRPTIMPLPGRRSRSSSASSPRRRTGVSGWCRKC